MNNTISSSVFVVVIMVVINMVILAVIHRVPFLKRHIIGVE